MKKFISILLAVMLVASVVVTASAYTVWETDDPEIVVQAQTSDEAIAAYEAEFGVTVDTNKYLFLMPNGKNGFTGADGTTLAGSWYNDYSKGAGVYWWGSAEACPDAWAGYQCMAEDEKQNIWYSNVPVIATTFIFNNGVDGGEDPDAMIYSKAAQTVNIPCEYPDPDEYDTIPEGADSFDNCIFVIDPDQISINELSGVPTCGGDWYFYYENGCFGSYAKDSANFKSVEENCKNPDHFVDGVHVGYHESADPTEPAPTEAAPTEPAPTEPAPTEAAPTEAAPTEPAPTVLRGDYDEDEQITIMDATRAQNIIAELTARPAEDFLVAVDADGDKDLTIMDATRIQNVVAELMDMDGNPANA